MSSNDRPFFCAKCNINFTLKKNLSQHKRKFHPLEPDVVQNYKNICCICKCGCRRMTDLHAHLGLQHDINLEFEKKAFYSEEEFEKWKSEIECQTQSSYIKHGGDKKSFDGTITTFSYFCHRSGSYKPKKCRKRRLKIIGSNKIGSTCPSQIVVHKQVVEEIMEISVEYQSIHVGHECEIERIRLTKEERDELAEHLQRGIPKATVLMNLQKEISPTRRLALVHKKDLHNICRGYKIDSEGNDFSSNDLDEKLYEEQTAIGEESNSESDMFNSVDFEQRKAEAYSKLQNFANACMSCQTEESLNAVYEGIIGYEASYSAAVARQWAISSVSKEVES